MKTADMSRDVSDCIFEIYRTGNAECKQNQGSNCKHATAYGGVWEIAGLRYRAMTFRLPLQCLGSAGVLKLQSLPQ